jgi:hypothetical protein
MSGKDIKKKKTAGKTAHKAPAHPQKKADHGKSKPAPAKAKVAPPKPAPPAKAAPALKAAPAKPGAPAKAAAPAPAKGGKGAAPLKGGAPSATPGKPEKRKGSRKTTTRRGDYPPGELLLPGGPNGPDEIQYLLRGCAAAERPAVEAGVTEILTKRALPESERAEWTRYAQGMAERFLTGTIENLLPIRPVQRRNFAGVVERAKHRRREIGAFLRGLDLGHTESGHMDSHGEDSLEKLMQWAARLENLAEADEPESADYAMFHRGLDQIENQTEALIVDVENTLRRLRDRVRPQKG